MSSPARFEVGTFTNFKATDRVNVEGISLIVGISSGFSIIDVNSLSNIVAEGATLENRTGDLLLSTLTNGENHPDASAGITGFTGVGRGKGARFNQRYESRRSEQCHCQRS